MTDQVEDPSVRTFSSESTTVHETDTPIVIVSEPSDLVTQMKREVFGNSYNLTARSTKQSIGCLHTRDIVFSLSNGTTTEPPNTFSFSVTYTPFEQPPPPVQPLIKSKPKSENPTKRKLKEEQPLTKRRLKAEQGVYVVSANASKNSGNNANLIAGEAAVYWLSPGEEETTENNIGFRALISYAYTGIESSAIPDDTNFTNGPNVLYEVIVLNSTKQDEDPVVKVTVSQMSITFVNMEELLNLRTVYSGEKWENTPLINILSTTETFLGDEIGQVGFDSLMSKDCCLSKNGDVKYFNNISQLSDYPCLTKTIEAPGNTLIEKVFYLANKHDPTMLKLTFLSLIASYAMLRYYIWYSLNDHVFDINILYRENTCNFVKTVKSSKYAPYKEVFTQTAIKGFDEYFKYSSKKVRT